MSIEKIPFFKRKMISFNRPSNDKQYKISSNRHTHVCWLFSAHFFVFLPLKSARKNNNFICLWKNYVLSTWSFPLMSNVIFIIWNVIQSNYLVAFVMWVNGQIIDIECCDELILGSDCNNWPFTHECQASYGNENSSNFLTRI